jgi:hypothetical protein
MGSSERHRNHYFGISEVPNGIRAVILAYGNIQMAQEPLFWLMESSERHKSRYFGLWKVPNGMGAIISAYGKFRMA